VIPRAPEQVLLPGHLEGEGLLDALVGGDVLDLDPLGPLEGDVCVHTEAALPLAVEDAEVLEDRPEFVQEPACLLRGAHVRFGDDLEERDARPVVIDERVLRPTRDVDEPARVLFEVHPGDPDDLLVPLVVLDLDRPLDRERFVVLRDLVGLREVGVEIVLPGELRLFRDRHTECFCDAEAVLDRLSVDPRERSGQAETDRTAVGVRLVVAVVRRAPAEEFRRGRELDVDLEPDDRLHALTSCS